MAKTKTNWIREHYPEILMSVVIAAIVYAVTTTYRNQIALERQSDSLKAVQVELRSMKQGLVAVLMDKNTDKTRVIQDLVSDATTLEGAKHFAAGQYEQAYEIWRPAAALGNTEALAAIAVADAALQQKALNTDLPLEERKEAAHAAGMGGTFHFPERQDGEQ